MSQRVWGLALKGIGFSIFRSTAKKPGLLFGEGGAWLSLHWAPGVLLKLWTAACMFRNGDGSF